jgi:hypothetical protein
MFGIGTSGLAWTLPPIFYMNQVIRAADAADQI